jgi:hypothetical protein
MFRSTTIISELVLSLAKVIFMLKHSVKLRRYMLCGGVAACPGPYLYCGLCSLTLHSPQYTHSALFYILLFSLLATSFFFNIYVNILWDSIRQEINVHCM